MRKRSRKRKAKPRPEYSIRIERLRGTLKQHEFAAKIPVSPSRISEWESGKRPPVAEGFYRLGSLADNPDDAIWFWRQAGLDDDALLVAARKIAGDRAKEGEPLLEKREVVLVARFRETLKGREEAGPPVPLPAEFIPNPGSTICVVVSQIDFGMAFAPRGLFVVDESVKDADALSALWERVVLLDYPSAIGLYPGGLYVGRLHMGSHGARPGSGVPLDTRYLAWHGWLRSLETPAQYQSIHFGEWRHPLFEKYNVRQPNENWRPREVLPSEIEEFKAACSEAEQRAPKEFRLPEGIRILGKVIGRLTGHLK